MSKLDTYLLEHSNKLAIFLVVWSLILFIIGSLLYYKLNENKRKVLQTIVSSFGNFILILNIIFLVYDKLLSSVNKKISDIKDLNKISLDTINNIFDKFYDDRKNLEGLYNEIFENKISVGEISLSYHEINFLFTVFQTIETIYRLYFVSGKEASILTNNQYEGWDNFILLICRSPKVQLFYKKNHQLFTSLNFEYYIGGYFKNVKIYVTDFPKF